MSIPVFRGGLILIDAMIVGVRSLLYAAEIAEEGETNSAEEDKSGRSEEIEKIKTESVDNKFENCEVNELKVVEDKTINYKAIEKKPVLKEEDIFDKLLKKIFKDKAYDAMIYISVFLALLMSIGIFILAPTLLVSYLRRFVDSNLIINMIEGIVRISLFVAYVVLIARMEDIKRVFQYHGAEHKAIYCYEHKEELTVENARKFSTLHPRCGTSFLFVVMVVSMLIFSLIGWPNPLVRVGMRLLLLPIVAGISYEIIKIASKSQSKLMMLVNYPGMMLQKLTTKEPDDSQLEVALEALKNVLKDDENVNNRASIKESND
ncbi:DUF1385 domain-containing protein [Alkaliphilus sp. AH-315-G20]|nr:DUF1385 domain-containing protein [bacterium AH-315-L21]MBN4062598.1 DUF1385 domain-containing protein [Alkaliphilus sp. AH-315-G20]